MLFNDVFDFIKKNGLTTIGQLERALYLDQHTLKIVIEKLTKLNKIKNINNNPSCCTTKKNCTGCTSLVKTDYYIAC